MALSKNYVYVICLSSLLIFSLKFALANARSKPSPAPEADSPTATPTPTGGGLLGVFDVTKYGAVADAKTDSKSAFQAAWTAACKYAGDSTFVPRGEFLVGLISFCGPCNKSPNVEIRGMLKALSDPSVFKEPTWLEFRDLSSINITGAGTGMLDGQGEASYTGHGCSGGQCPISLKITKVSGGTINNIALVNSKGFHMSLLLSSDILVRDMKITAPNKSPNTDGIHISQFTNINITSSTIGVSDDCISIGPGSNNIYISTVTCGPGHGIRVKSWPGSPPSKVSNLKFEDIIMTNVKNHIIIDQEYCPSKGCETKPSQVEISDVLFKNIKGTTTTKSEVTLACSSSMSCENVVLANINLKYILPDGPATSTCTNVKGISITSMENPQPCS
ncbi:hypothetical protein IFM89_006530 [Coptis chinensis]|uniref:Polygalacturonase n=1 Tax=Coptis chinensis TaxID=261450 RepID=A0A835M4I3_9MAGN|nr:hypothetical protein IFM89_006530 [Coptis chinensis]